MISHLVARGGYVAVFAAVALESLGVPVPGETTLVAASIYAGATHRLSVVVIVILAATAGVIGDNLGYLIGRTGGQRFVERFGRYVRLDEKNLRVSRYAFARHGGKIVFLGRFVTILRTYTALIAGLSDIAWTRFLPYNAVGAVLWAVVFGVGAYEFGSVITQLGTIMTLILGGTAVLAAVVVFVLVRRYGPGLRAKAGVAEHS